MAGPLLPDELRDRPFAIGELRALGLPESRLRHGTLHVPTRSVRSDKPLEGLALRATAFAAALPPDCAFSHVTAAVLLGIPLPAGVEEGTVLDVMRESRRPRIRRAGCCGHRGLEAREVGRVGAHRVVGPADTWVDLGEVISRGLGVDDLVVAGDDVVNRVKDGRALLARTLDARCRPRGRTLLLQALELVRAGVRSPQESRARLMFVRAGFPEPEVNGQVSADDGGWLLEGDLVWREQRVIGEYQGQDHASRRRRSADAHRIRVAEAEGWTVLELFAEDLDRRPRRQLTLRRFARALGLDPSTLRLD